MRHRVSLVTVAWRVAGVGAGLTGSVATCPAGTAGVGINLSFNTDWSTAAPWTDVTKMFRSWGMPDQPWVENTSLRLDANSYPLDPAGSMTSLLGYPDGVYKLSYTGTATVTFSSMGTATNVVHSGNTTTADVIIDHSKSTALYMKVTGLDPANPLGNMHLTVPGARPGQTFTDAFLHRMQPMSSIRMMDWQSTNNSTLTDWSQRATAASFCQTGPAGVALEYQLQLANDTGKDPWLNIPVSASDDYVRQMADLVKQQLGAGRNVYVEYSNELWNPHFQQYWTNLSNATANPVLTAPDNTGRAGQQAALRTKQIGDIFRQEFGTDAGRVKMVLGGQAAGTWFLSQGLGYLQTTYGSANRYVNDVAVAPYVNIPASVDTAGLTLDGLFAALNTELNTNVSTWIKNNAKVSATYGLPMLAYEGGQGLVPTDNGGANSALKLAAEHDRRMGDLTSRLMSLWTANGGSMFDYYSFVARDANSGGWGALTALSDPGSPKWDAILRAALPAGDATLDGVVNGDDLRVLLSNFGKPNMWWEQGDFTGDGRVDYDDLAVVDAALLRTAAVASPGAVVTPEPSVLPFLTLMIPFRAIARLRGRR